MLVLKAQSELVPSPRGPLPKVCAVAVAAVSMLVATILFGQSAVSWAATVALLLTWSPVLHRTFMLLEETLNQGNRYRGCPSLAALSACGLGKSVLPVGLFCLLLHLLGSPLPLTHLWTLFWLCPIVYAAFRSAGVLEPSEVELSDACEGRTMNVAHGLAWSFYLGYLRLVLPNLESSISAFCAAHLSSPPLWGRGSKRLLILIPTDASICHKLEEEDKRVQFYNSLPNCQLDRGGIRGRVYKHSVYRVLDDEGQAHDCVVEYATPLMTLWGMSQDSSGGLAEPQRRQQVLLFFRTLQDVLDRSLECRNRYTLVLLDDQHEDDPHYLSKCILGHLRQQDREEYTMGRPGTPLPQQEDVLSREPTLMYSLDKPRSLQGPVEMTDCSKPTPGVFYERKSSG